MMANWDDVPVFNMLYYGEKDPRDHVTLILDFDQELDDETGEVLVSDDTIPTPVVTATPIAPGTGTLTLTDARAIGTSAYIFCSGGIAGEKYKISFLVTTSSGQTINRSVEMEVQDR